MRRGLVANGSEEGPLGKTDLSEVRNGVVDRGCTMSGRNQSVINRPLVMEDFPLVIDLLSSDTLAHVNTVIELDNKRPDTALLAIDDELGPDDSIAGFTENRDSRSHILRSSPVGRVEDE